MKNVFRCFLVISRIVSAIFALLIVAGFVSDANAATFTVTRADDRNMVCNSGQDCSLREAVSAAASVNTDDTINFAENITTITLSGEIVITSGNGALSINGRGAKLLTIDGGTGTNRIFYVSLATLAITDVTLTDGNGTGTNFSNTGGAIYAILASLTLDRVHVTGNSAMFEGGIMYNGGTHSIRNSTFSNNIAATCGSLGSTDHNAGQLNLTIANSTFSGNTATSNGGAGGAMCINGTITMRSVTVFNNKTAGFGGGIYFGSGNVNISNSIVASNSAPNYPEIDNAGETIVSGGFNLIGDSTGDATNTNHPNIYQASDILDTPPLLLPLKAYGGSTPTNAPSLLSPALDQGLNSLEPNDQRGKTRPYNFPSIRDATGGNGSDIGAFERQGTSDNPLGVVFDFDGDSKTDISIYRPSVGEWWYLKSSNGGNAAFQFGASSDKIAPADFTGDGKTDIAFFRPSTGEWFILRSENQSYYSLPFGLAEDIPAPADYDGDGKADVAVFRPSTATWYIFRSTGGVTTQQFGLSEDIPVAGYYDEDGKADIAIYRPSVGEWWIQRSTAGLIAFQFGSSADKPVQGDYTGDGRADVAIWRPSSGEWFILRSEDYSYYSFPFGTNGDLPAPGDYDGDGRFDATVFRPSGSTWFVQRSTAGTLIQGFGATGDKPVPNAFVP